MTFDRYTYLHIRAVLRAMEQTHDSLHAEDWTMCINIDDEEELAEMLGGLPTFWNHMDRIAGYKYK